MPPLGRRHCQLAAGIVYGCNLSFGYNPPRRRQPPGIAEMGIVEKAQAAAPSRLADVDRFRLRRFVEGLGDDLETISAATDLADVAAILEGNPSWRCCSACIGPERQNWSETSPAAARGSRAFGVKPNELLPELPRRLRNKAGRDRCPRAEAPAQQVVLTATTPTSPPSGPSRARRRRRPSSRSTSWSIRERLDQCWRAPPYAPWPPRSRHRPGLAQRSARDLKRAPPPEAAARELRRRRASDRPSRGHAPAGRRARAGGGAGRAPRR